MLAKDLIMAWFDSEQEWRRVRAACSDGHRLGASFRHWLLRSTELESELSSRGHVIQRVVIQADEFLAFCAEQKLNPDNLARHRFMALKIGVTAEEVGRHEVQEPRPRTAIAWFTEEEYRRLRAFAPQLCDTSYEQWQRDLDRALVAIAQRGRDPVRIDIELDKLQRWCAQEGLTLDRDALAAYVKHRLRTIDHQDPVA